MAEDQYEEEVSDLLLKEQLVAELDAARVDLRRAQNRLNHRMDVKRQARSFVSDKKPVLIATAVPLVAAFVYKLFSKKKRPQPEKTKKTLLRTGGGLILGMVVKPYLRKWVMGKAKSYLSNRAQRLP